MSALGFSIPVIGDVHLGPNDRQPQRAAALEAITKAGLELADLGRLGAWFYVGDLFHQASRPADRNYLADVLTDQAQAAPVVIVRGNHDGEGELSLFERLGTKFPIHVVETPGVIALDLATGQTLGLAVFPWPWESALLAAGVPIAGIREAARQALEPVFIGLGQDLERHRQAGHAVAFLAHATITGAIASNGQPQVGPGIELDGELLAHLGDCPKLLGHIHKPQTLADAGAAYVGSICRLDFGEVERKRWILLEAEQVEQTVRDPEKRDGLEYLRARVWGYTLHDVALEVAPLWTIEAATIMNPENTADRVVFWQDPPDAPSSWAGAEVRVRFRYPVALRSRLEDWTKDLREHFTEAARLELELVAVPDAGLRSPAVAEAVTLEAKVRAWADASGTVLPGHLAEALDLLTHHPDDVVLDEVRANLEELERKDPPQCPTT